MTPARTSVTKKIVFATVGFALLASVGLFLWVKTTFTSDALREALAHQLSAAVGQRVTVGSVDATIFPRVTVTLRDVRIGEPSHVELTMARVGTELRALLSRRIAHGTLSVEGARLALPVPAFSRQIAGDTSHAWPLEIVSIDSIALRGIEITSAGRSVKGNVDAVPLEDAFAIKASLVAEGTRFDVTGTIANLSGPVAEIQLTADALNVGELVQAVPGFATPAGGKRPGMDVRVSLNADRAAIGALTVTKLAGRGHLTDTSVTLTPIAFELFGGRYDGSLTFDPTAATTGFHAQAAATGINIADAAAFAGLAGVVSGRLNGRLDCSGQLADEGNMMPTVRGTARIDASNGIVKNLGLVRAVALATSMRHDAATALAAASKDEPFSQLGATLSIANNTLTTNDLRFESKDLIVNARGAIRVDTQTLNLSGTLQLSSALSAQAGRDLYRYTQVGGRVTLPVKVSGSIAAPQVSIDVPDLIKRGLWNALEETLRKR